MIRNLEELKKNTNKEIVKRIVTEYLMETVAQKEAFEKLEETIDNMSDTDVLTIKQIREIIDNIDEE